MKISWNYLQSFFSEALDKELVLQRLTMAGLEVEAETPLAPEFSGIVVAKVIECVKHPEADKLSLCKVDAGSGELLQILCGAGNVKAGVKVPCAKVGAVLPGNFKIAERKMRGLMSYGMLCSADEIGQTNGVDGLLLLADDAPVGEDIRKYLDLDDSIIEFKITPNRGDCLSYRGLAREVAALSGAQLKPQQAQSERLIDNAADFSLEVTASEECPHYIGLLMDGVNNNQQSPAWLVKILERSAIRSISPVVDITNYVLLVYGQPMHAFERAKTANGIKVRMAKDGESLQLIDGKQAHLSRDTLLICNGDDQPLAIAGVMGGLDSALTDLSTSIVLESAFFSPAIVHGKAKQYGVSSDAAFRYERGVDVQIQHAAINLAANLINQVCGGTVGGFVHYTNPVKVVPRPIELSFARIKRFIGQEIAPTRIVQILQDLGCQVSHDERQLSVVVPSYRFDLTLAEDIIEEIIRVYGYDNIQAVMPKLEYTLSNLDQRIAQLDQYRQSLVNNGFAEIISYAFIEERYAKLLASVDKPQVKLQNSIAGLGLMRNNLLGGLVKTLQYNVNRGQASLKIFELARVFHGEEAEVQPLYLAGLIYGNHLAVNWSEKPRNVDFYDLKSVVEELLSPYGAARFLATGEQHACHPGRSATICLGQQTVGYIGQLHPELAQELDLEQLPYVFELNLDLLQKVKEHTVSPTHKFQKVSRDLAWVLAKDVAVGEMLEQINGLAISELRQVRIFDVFYGIKNSDGDAGAVKSVALNFIFQGDKTLSDEDINQKLDLIKQLASDKFAAQLR